MTLSSQANHDVAHMCALEHRDTRERRRVTDREACLVLAPLPYCILSVLAAISPSITSLAHNRASGPPFQPCCHSTRQQLLLLFTATSSPFHCDFFSFAASSCSSTGVVEEKVQKISVDRAQHALMQYQTGSHRPACETRAPTMNGATMAATLERQLPTPETRPTWARVTSR